MSQCQGAPPSAWRRARTGFGVIFTKSWKWRARNGGTSATPSIASRTQHLPRRWGWRGRRSTWLLLWHSPSQHYSSVFLHPNNASIFKRQPHRQQARFYFDSDGTGAATEESLHVERVLWRALRRERRRTLTFRCSLSEPKDYTTANSSWQFGGCYKSGWLCMTFVWQLGDNCNDHPVVFPEWWISINDITHNYNKQIDFAENQKLFCTVN